jgi:hypothetical protein
MSTVRNKTLWRGKALRSGERASVGIVGVVRTRHSPVSVPPLPGLSVIHVLPIGIGSRLSTVLFLK